ncbi:MAG TPA: glycosyltransferase [Nocardioidaceae bacterium]|nr:glycosyltransferase [Nocardioidaceae bacterium]
MTEPTAPAADGAERGTSTRQFRTVQRTVLRESLELDVLPLYVGGLVAQTTAGGASGARQSGSFDEGEDEEETDDLSADYEGGAGGGGEIVDRHATARPERRLTFATYFNAFPASYWRRWTEYRSVRLRAEVSGLGTFIVYRSTAKGHIQRVQAISVDSVDPQALELDLSLGPFIDGGWYWFEIQAASQPITLHGATWSIETERAESGRASIGITTFNRPDFCVAQLLNLLHEPEVLAALDEIIVVDQGTDKVSEHARYAEAAEGLGGKLRIIEQGNLGGSGGFSRAMHEVASKGQSDYVLLLDDDVVCEAEGILRAVALADLAKQPTIVGGQMFSLYVRSVLHAFGETVQQYRWFWGPAPNTTQGHDFARRSLRSTSWLHRRIDVDYNGWWMCLIPTKVVKDIGLSLPMFIKWDDAEFGLRARAAGYPTVTMPGVAVWHVPWTEKDDTVDWQSYYHRRNRIVSALLYSPYPRGGRLVRESLDMQFKFLMSMQYGPAEMGLMAIEDILDGTQRMHRDLLSRLDDLRELRKGFDDANAQPDLDRYPAPKRSKPPRRGRTPTMPRRRPAKVKEMVAGTLRQFLPIRPMSREHPEVGVPHLDTYWWRLSHYDSALVSSADGSAAWWYKRNPEQFRDILVRSVRLHARLAREWPRLSAEFKEALPGLVSPDTWKATFDASLHRVEDRDSRH